MILFGQMLVCIFQHHGSHMGIRPFLCVSSHIDPGSPLSSQRNVVPSFQGIGTAADLSSSGLSAGRWYCRNGAPKKDGDL